MRALMAGMAVLSVVAVGCGGDKSSGSSGPQFSCDKVQPAGFPLSAEGKEVGDTAPDLSFVTRDGDTSCTRDFTNKVTLINVAAGWCPPCQSETPGFQDVYEEFKDEGFVILQAMFEDYNGGSPDDAFLDEWRDEYGVTFTMIGDSGNDFWDTYVPASNTGYIPHNLLVDKDGIIAFSAKGGMSESSLRTRVNALVGAEPTLVFEE